MAICPVCGPLGLGHLGHAAQQVRSRERARERHAVDELARLAFGDVPEQDEAAKARARARLRSHEPRHGL